MTIVADDVEALESGAGAGGARGDEEVADGLVVDFQEGDAEGKVAGGSLLLVAKKEKRREG